MTAPPTGWPRLTLSEWADTRDTLHLWTQVVGKIRLALEPMVNHWWQVTLYVSARGLTTSLMHASDRGLEIEFDFVDHVAPDRARPTASIREIRARARARWPSFYASNDDGARGPRRPVSIVARPVEVRSPSRSRRTRSTAPTTPAAAQPVLAGTAPGPPRDERIPGPLHRQGQPRALLLGGA